MLALFCITHMRSRGMAAPLRDAASEAGHADAAGIEREIHSHLQAIAFYEDEASSSDAQLRAFAQRILPQLQRHLALLRSLKAGKNHGE